ncbi:hypothetical protein RF11_14526 [Thelohanellus kitauei]|uniref:Uncharacterized protein n=1 Tax=Thelohanellus kitauei TaxID=669202 RepID=A0A0C2JA42_THEKT|nr:hypothetical protein RF11_14526 [Thelohanellus kitauei]
MFTSSKLLFVILASALFTTSHCDKEEQDTEFIEEEIEDQYYCSEDENSAMTDAAQLMVNEAEVPEDKRFYQCVLGKQLEMIKSPDFAESPIMEPSDIETCCDQSDKFSTDEKACQDISNHIYYCLLENLEVFKPEPVHLCTDFTSTASVTVSTYSRDVLQLGTFLRAVYVTKSAFVRVEVLPLVVTIDVYINNDANFIGAKI